MVVQLSVSCSLQLPKFKLVSAGFKRLDWLSFLLHSSLQVTFDERGLCN